MAEAKKSGWLLKLVLVISLGINLAIGGLALGVWAIDKPKRPPAPTRWPSFPLRCRRSTVMRCARSL